jgi:hypothetical protein
VIDFKMFKHAVMRQCADAYKDNAMWEEALTQDRWLEKD